MLAQPNTLAKAALTAYSRISPHIRPTPLLASPWLSGVVGPAAQVFLKLESENHTNSFKVRGALNKVGGLESVCYDRAGASTHGDPVSPPPSLTCVCLSLSHTHTHTQILSLTPQQLSKGLVTCSTGNHAAAFLWASSVVPAAQQADSTIYLPTTVSPAKLSRLLAQGAKVVQHSDDCAVAEVEARRVADEAGLTYISPYNDWEVGGWVWTRGAGCRHIANMSSCACV